MKPIIGFMSLGDAGGSGGNELLIGLMGALAGVVGAFVAGGFLVLNGNKQRKAEQARMDRDARRRHRQRQLTELYRPLVLERRRSELLRTKLPEWEPDGTRWRLVHHIADAKAETEWSAIVERILESGDQIARLLREKAGLVEQSPPPQSFAKFLLHHELLKLSWETGKNQDPNDSHPFPGKGPTDPGPKARDPDDDLDSAIALACEAIEADLATLMGEEVERERGRPL